MTDFRALCAELVDEAIYLGSLPYEQDPDPDLIVRARAALAQPEPQGVIMPVPGDAEGLAEVFWGRYDQPEPQGPSDEVWEALKERLWHQYETRGYQGERFIYDSDFYTALDVVRQELASWGRPAIEPVAVTERLPGPEDCDAEGRCWWFNPGLRASSNPHIALSSWRLTHMLASKPMGTYWLPHHALPVPQQEVE